MSGHCSSKLLGSVGQTVDDRGMEEKLILEEAPKSRLLQVPYEKLVSLDDS